MSRIDRWSSYLSKEDLDIYRKAEWGGDIGMGARPALLNIDTTHLWVDPAYPMCEREEPEIIDALTRITETFRKLGLPICYSRRDDRSHVLKKGMWNHKMGAYAKGVDDPRADQWPEAYAPREQDLVVMKNKPSIFFGTSLESWLRYDGVDTVVIVGFSTSCCIRAAATDAFSHNFRTIVIKEACGERCPAAHLPNLFDMDMKFADVESIDDVIAELESRFDRIIHPKRAKL